MPVRAPSPGPSTSQHGAQHPEFSATSSIGRFGAASRLAVAPCMRAAAGAAVTDCALQWRGAADAPRAAQRAEQPGIKRGRGLQSPLSRSRILPCTELHPPQVWGAGGAAPAPASHPAALCVARRRRRLRERTCTPRGRPGGRPTALLPASRHARRAPRRAARLVAHGAFWRACSEAPPPPPPSPPPFPHFPPPPPPLVLKRACPLQLPRQRVGRRGARAERRRGYREAPPPA